MGFTVSAGPGYQNQHLIPQELAGHDVLKAIADFNIDDDVYKRLPLPDKATTAAYF